ncbi:arylesterase [Orrella daihaiensis]|uniref:Arylesterase n=1 Tax=Orrella daihaiensis TaxID=2782176 RepID=A0ABY4AJN5_9BURK|nr:arylesterase [Orrella daihaiensis]UOD49315.1 arylesterase [Orrella daihaiensis]
MYQLSHYWNRFFINIPLTKLTFLIFVGLVLFGTAHASTPKASLDRPILIVGDSLSSEYGIKRQSGWVQLLRNRLAEQYPEPPEVINASISGDTTSGGVTRLPALLKEHNPGLVIIELGGNDALRGLALDMTRNNLTRMVELSQKAGALTIVTGIQIPANYGPAYTEAFRSLYPEIAAATNSVLVPFLLAGLETDRNLFIEDGIHPSEQAQPILLENVWPAVQSALPAATP